MPKAAKGARIYNLFPRLVGQMSDWENHYDRIKDLGFDWIYVNPFHYPGFSGSLYAPKDYYEFNPLFIDSASKIPPMKQLEQAVSAAHKKGLKMIMDLVINHTAKDHPFTKKHPDWYIRDEKGEVKSPGAWDGDTFIEWGDLAEIDNAHSKDKEKLWAYWEELVMFYIEKGFDGFRADAAYQIPTELWQRLITTAKKKYPQVVFFAESLGCSPEQTKELAQAGFDYIFNSSKYWDFSQDWLLQQLANTRTLAPSISFPESHDTPRLAYTLDNNIAAIKQRTAFCAFFSAGWMITMGFEYGFENKTDVVHTLPDQWEDVNINLSDYIKEINAIKKQYNIFNEDSETVIIDNPNWANIIVMLQRSNDNKERALVIINKDLHNQQELYLSDLCAAMEVKDAAQIKDISIGHRMDALPARDFHYNLAPAEYKLLYAKV